MAGLTTRKGLTRRQLIASAPVVALASYLPDIPQAEQARSNRSRFKQSGCRWCYASIPLRDFCQAVVKMGLTAIDLLTPDEWPVAREFGLTCSMGSGLDGNRRGISDSEIRTIRDNQQWIAHYHTGGVPGRNEIDDSQELHYPAIVRAIADSGFTGFVAHEFVPKRDPLTSLREAVVLCAI